MNVLQSLVFDEVCQRRILRAADVRTIRALYAENATVSQTEIAALLTINQACFVQDPSWGDFLVEALTAFVVDDLEPAGSVTAENAAWLMTAIAPAGELMSLRLRECAITLMSRATPTPRAVRLFLLTCLRRDLETDTGATASLLARNPEAVARHVVELADVILTSIPAGGLELSRAELETVRAIDRLSAVRGRPAWVRFVEALTAVSLLELADYPTPDGHTLAAYVGTGDTHVWPVAALERLSADALRLRALERQRAEIVVGETADAAGLGDFAAVWASVEGYAAARQALIAAGYQLPAARALQAADAA